MKNLFFLLFLTSKIAISQNDDRLGIGIVNLNYPKKPLLFLEDTVKKKVKYRIPFSAKEKISETLLNNSWLIPVQSLFFGPEGIPNNFDMICMEHQRFWLRVKVDPKSDASYWVHIDESLSFFEWNKYLNSKFCVRRIDGKNKIRKLNSVTSDSIDSKRYDCSKVIEVKGYWLKVKPFMNKQGETVTKDDGSFGWIQWRNKNSLMIYYYNN